MNYKFEQWLDEHGYSYQYFRGTINISYDKYDGYDIEYLGLYQGKFTFWCKNKNYDVLGNLNVKFDVPFNEKSCDYIHNELFRQLNEFVEHREKERLGNIKKINKLFNKLFNESL